MPLPPPSNPRFDRRRPRSAPSAPAPLPPPRPHPRARQRHRSGCPPGTALAAGPRSPPPPCSGWRPPLPSPSWGCRWPHLDQRLDHITATASQQTLTAAGRAALLDPAARRSVLAASGTHSQPVPVVVASVVVEPSGAAYLFNQRLPDLPVARTYQLWALHGTRAVSIALLGAHPSTVAFRVDPATEAAVLALTVEPAGGSVAPSMAPIATQAR